MNEVAPNVNERSRSFYIVLASIIIINLVIALVTKIYFFDY